MIFFLLIISLDFHVWITKPNLITLPFSFLTYKTSFTIARTCRIIQSNFLSLILCRFFNLIPCISFCELTKVAIFSSAISLFAQSSQHGSTSSTTVNLSTYFIISLCKFYKPLIAISFFVLVVS